MNDYSWFTVISFDHTGETCTGYFELYLTEESAQEWATKHKVDIVMRGRR